MFGAISLPIGIAMGLATMLCLVFATNIDPIMVAQNAFAGIDSFSLMAIPFFMLAGNFMRYGGISKRLLDLADNIVGFFTGGAYRYPLCAASFLIGLFPRFGDRCDPGLRVLRGPVRLRPGDGVGHRLVHDPRDGGEGL